MVAFSELALTGLQRAPGGGDRAKAWRSAIALFLLQPAAIEKSFQMRTNLMAELYLLPLGEARVYWEQRSDGSRTVWSVTFAQKK